MFVLAEQMALDEYDVHLKIRERRNDCTVVCKLMRTSLLYAHGGAQLWPEWV